MFCALNPTASHPIDTSTHTPCMAVCLERGTHIDQVLHPLPHHVNRNGSDINTWVNRNCQKAEFGFISYAANPAIIYWINNGALPSFLPHVKIECEFVL